MWRGREETGREEGRDLGNEGGREGGSCGGGRRAAGSREGGGGVGAVDGAPARGQPPDAKKI